MNIEYKQTEIGLIPEDWTVRKIGELAKIRMCKRIFAEQTTETGDIPFFKIGTFGGIPDAYISRSIYDEYKAKYSYPSKGDILISAAGTLGRTVVFDGNDAYFQDSNIVWLDIDKSQICNEYLNHYYKVIVWNSSEGSTIARLYNGIIESTYIAYPSLPEQQHIAEALSDVDALIASLEKLIAKKKAIKQGVMQRLLTGKTRLPGFGFEGKWEEVRVEDIANFSTLTVLFKKTDIKYYIGTDNMIADKGGICENKIDIEYNNVREYITDDILLSNIRPYLKKIWFADRCGGCSNDVLVIRCKDKSVIIPQFLFYLLSQDIFFDVLTENAIGTKMPRGDKSVIKSFVLHIPTDIHEQKAVVAVLSDIDKEIESLSQKLAKTRQLKQGMMQQLLTGKIRLV